jgi:hypothetical protein
VLAGNGTTLAIANSFRASEAGGLVTARLVPLAWTPLGIVAGDTRQDVAVPLAGLFDWIDRTFPPEDDRAFIAPMRDLELLARVEWEAPLPAQLTEANVINIEDLPDEIVDALAREPMPLEQCAACRRLCVRDDFVWKERQLCAWDYHAQVFGRRGPWHDGVYEERHLATLPACTYVAAALLAELNVEEVLTLRVQDEEIAKAVVRALVEQDREHSHMMVRTQAGFSVLREA